MFENVRPEDLEAGRRALGGGGVGAPLKFTVDRGEGCVLYDTSGRGFIDCTSQAWSLAVGYSHPKVIAAVQEILPRYTHIRTSFETPPKLLLAKRMAELAPGNLKKVSFVITGSEANEGAIKLALRNSEKSSTVVSLFDGYHGRTLGMINTGYPHPNNRFTAWGGPVVRVPQAYCYRCPIRLEYPSCKLACVDLAREIITRGAAEPPAALIMEPVQGNGGMVEFPREYFGAMRKLCDDLGMLLIFDEIQTGFGRVGEWFAADLYQTTPDILVFGKSVAGGFPLFGNLYRPDLKGFEPGDHSFTFAHFPVAMAAALATIQVIEDENLLENSRKIGRFFTETLQEMQSHYELIGDIRGPALMLGVELVKNRKTREPARHEADRFITEGLKRGVIFGESKYLGMGNIVKVKPPLTINESQAQQVMEVFRDVLETISSSRE